MCVCVFVTSLSVGQSRVDLPSRDISSDDVILMMLQLNLCVTIAACVVYTGQYVLVSATSPMMQQPSITHYP